MSLRASFFSLLFCSGVAAQTFNVSYISPVGIEFHQANGTSDIMLGNWAPDTRTQQSDNNLVGLNFRIVRFIGWRRRGLGGAGAAKSTDLTIIMSHADYNTVGATFASNYKDQPVTVFTMKRVNLPDWNAPVVVDPAPFDLVVPLDVPFIYNGQDALLWDVLNNNNPMGAYMQDWVASTTHNYGAYPTELSTGCTTANGTFLHRCSLRTDLTNLQMGFFVRHAPTNSPVLVIVGATDPNLNIPGLCAAVRAQPLLFLPLAAASPTGHINTQYLITTPFTAAFAGVPLHTQALATDTTQPVYPVVLSNGLRSTAPLTTGTGAINVKRVYHTSSTTAPTGTYAVTAVPTIYAF